MHPKMETPAGQTAGPACAIVDTRSSIASTIENSTTQPPDANLRQSIPLVEPKSSSKATALKFQWYDQVSGDHKLIRSCFHVAYHISRWFKYRIDEGSIEGWRSLELLSKDAGLSVTGVRNALSELASRNHLSVRKGNGRTHANTYQMIISNERVKALPASTLEKEQSGSHLFENVLLAEGVSRLPECCNCSSEKGASRVATNPSHQSSERIL